MALVVITGGARSGKSAVAVALAEERGGDVCVVVSGDDGDPEMADRIAKHRAGRPEHWTTLERSETDALLVDPPAGALVLLDCLGSIVTRVMESEWDAEAFGSAYGEADIVPAPYAEAVEARVDALVAELRARDGDTVVVTNEAGDGVVPAFALGRLFRDVLGRANRRLVSSADVAWLVVAGRCLQLTSLPSAARWPQD